MQKNLNTTSSQKQGTKDGLAFEAAPCAQLNAAACYALLLTLIFQILSQGQAGRARALQESRPRA
jgi:hypothetical protein